MAHRGFIKTHAMEVCQGPAGRGRNRRTVTATVAAELARWAWRAISAESGQPQSWLHRQHTVVARADSVTGD